MPTTPTPLLEGNALILSTTYVAAGIILAWLLLRFFSEKNLRHIPTEGGLSVPIFSLFGFYSFFVHGPELLARGYEAHKGKVFKVAMVDRWLVVLTGKKLVDELQGLSDDKLSPATTKIFNMHHIFGIKLHEDSVHLPLLRGLTRNLAIVFADMYDEIDMSFCDFVPANSDRWTPVHVCDIMGKIVARSSNRIFIGNLPVCRDAGFVHMMVHFSEDVEGVVKLLMLAPESLKSLIARRATVGRRIQQCLDYLKPVILERMALIDQFRDNWADKPNDMLQWTIDEVRARNQGPEDVARLVLFVNFGAIETTAQATTHALYDLSVRPDIATILREEVQAAIDVDGWTRTAVNKMHKLDSFLRESQRFNAATTVSMFRTIRQSMTLSDGSYLPKGTTVVTPIMPTHFDEEYYPNASVFDPFRYVKEKNARSVQQSLITTSSDYVTFGHGKHACPGRFFAGNVLKALTAYVLVNYDIKPEQAGFRPQNIYRGLRYDPDTTARVLFKKRRME